MLCSTAAGRYQFLSKTWDGLAPGLGLGDFTPPNQEKAALEIIRRQGAYNRVLRSSVYENFTSALSKLNTTWASLPGVPGQRPTGAKIGAGQPEGWTPTAWDPAASVE